MHTENRNQLIIVELLTLFILVILTLWSVSPLLEEWEAYQGFNQYGSSYVFMRISQLPLRPSHLIGYFLQWIVGHGRVIGVSIATSMLLITRYLITCWAVSPLTQGYNRWVIATLAATLFPWPGAWLGRFAAAQLSTLFFFIALGFSIRLFQRWSFIHAIGCMVSVILLLTLYQGLALCLMAIPITSLLWGNFAAPREQRKQPIIICIARVALPLIIGFVIYGIYCFFILTCLNKSGYEGTLVEESNRLLTANGLWVHVQSAYTTAFVKEILLLPAFLLTIFFLCWDTLSRLSRARSQLVLSMLIVLFVTFLPILSLVYVSELHIHDPDRVLFPISVGFVLICISFLAQPQNNYLIKANILNLRAFVIIIVWLIMSNFVAADIRHYGQIQKTIINQVLPIIEKNNPLSLIIRDTTGVLGDVYTLFDSTLSFAIAFYGKQTHAVICTPLSVDRLHPHAKMYPISSTPRCEDLPATHDHPLILTVRWDSQDALVVDR